jgi:hypothetical protein
VTVRHATVDKITTETVQGASAARLFRSAPLSAHRNSLSDEVAALERLGRDLHGVAVLDSLRFRNALDVRNPRRPLAARLRRHGFGRESS